MASLPSGDERLVGGALADIVTSSGGSVSLLE